MVSNFISKNERIQFQCLQTHQKKLADFQCKQRKTLWWAIIPRLIKIVFHPLLHARFPNNFTFQKRQSSSNKDEFTEHGYFYSEWLDWRARLSNRKKKAYFNCHLCLWKLFPVPFISSNLALLASTQVRGVCLSARGDLFACPPPSTLLRIEAFNLLAAENQITLKF